MISFEEAFDRLLGHEGGYSNRAPEDDPGGETNWGISKRSYPYLNIKDLTRDQARLIYARDFWKPVCNGADSAIVFQAFDFAVNSGIQTAIRKLQTAVGVADDGHWGPASNAALLAMEKNDVLMRYNAERIDFMRKLKNAPSNLSGWMARIANNLRYAAQDN